MICIDGFALAGLLLIVAVACAVSGGSSRGGGYQPRASKGGFRPSPPNCGSGVMYPKDRQ